MTEVAIIGDRFMAPEVFDQALRRACGESIKVHSHTLPWPDDPVVYGYGFTNLSRLRKFMGTAEDTVARIGGAEILATKCDAFFVNAARGSLADCDALDRALASGHLGGAALETFAVESIPFDSPLLNRAKVFLAPHIAGASIRTVRIAAAGGAEEVRRFLSGERPLSTC